MCCINKFIDSGDVAISMNGDDYQVPSYDDVMETPKQDHLAGPNNTTATPTAPPDSGGDLPPPPCYEQV